MMDKKAAIFLAALLMAPLAAQAQMETELYVKRPIHLGDNNLTDWKEDPLTEGVEYNRTFIIQGGTNRVSVDFLVSDVNFKDNPVRVNNKTIGYLCWDTPKILLKGRYWNICNITVPPGLLIRGKNSVEIRSAWEFIVQEYDDIMFQSLSVNADYKMLMAHLAVAKLQSDKEVMLGETSNVTVMITNIGIRPAHNVTAYDSIPPTCDLVAGLPNATADWLREGDVLRYEYQMRPNEIGNVTAWPGRVDYVNDSSVIRKREIEPTRISVRPLRPLITVRKKVAPDSLEANTTLYVEVTVANERPETAYHVNVQDYLPDSFKMTSGKTNITVEAILSGGAESFNYTAQPTMLGTFYMSPVARYTDSRGNLYEETGEPANVTVLRNSSLNSGNRMWIIAAMVFLIMVMAAVYVQLRK
jgi:uncharacterized repeat protein (TIGR01451 family)